MSESEPTFYRENDYGRYDEECPNPSRIGCGLQDRYCLRTIDKRGNKIQFIYPIINGLRIYSIGKISLNIIQLFSYPSFCI